MTTHTAWILQPWSNNVDLSVILGTYNRLKPLQACLAGIRAAVGKLTYEIVVCDGGSTDGSREWLAGQHDVVLFGDQQLTGAVAAFNQGFALSRGRYIATLNDDCLPDPGVLERGVNRLAEDPKVGQVAFELCVNGIWTVNKIHELHWANYGIIRASLARRIAAICGGLWAPAYLTYAADVELSCWVWRLGYRVEPLAGRVADLPVQDALRARNAHSGIDAAKLLYQRWPSAEHITGVLAPNVPQNMITRLHEALRCDSM